MKTETTIGLDEAIARVEAGEGSLSAKRYCEKCRATHDHAVEIRRSNNTLCFTCMSCGTTKACVRVMK